MRPAKDMMRRVNIAFTTLAAIWLCSIFQPHVSRADEAVVLPKGMGRIFVDSHFYLPFDKRFDQNGNAVPYAQPFNTSLNSVLIPSLSPLNAFVPGGVASFGTSNVSVKRHLKEFLIQPA